MPFMALDPPSVRPTVVAIARLPVCSVGSVLNGHVMAGSNSVRVKPAGMRIHGLVSGGPASSRQTVVPGSSVSRAASTQPAAPAPTMT